MSSHREAPGISKDPVADSTDVYAFVSPDKPDMVTLIANYVPLQGPAGIFGPSCELSAQLATEEINATGGVLGREVQLVVVDGRPADLAGIRAGVVL